MNDGRYPVVSISLTRQAYINVKGIFNVSIGFLLYDDVGYPLPKKKGGASSRQFHITEERPGDLSLVESLGFQPDVKPDEQRSSPALSSESEVPGG